ncbi:hypothetical protein LX36DRAFT_289262 [Colletotrichum falcatum]|nr:hypothetical protein LX36DRAFT_289262 [Colletotrichum falcatum]
MLTDSVGHTAYRVSGGRCHAVARKCLSVVACWLKMGLEPGVVFNSLRQRQRCRVPLPICRRRSKHRLWTSPKPKRCQMREVGRALGAFVDGRPLLDISIRVAAEHGLDGARLQLIWRLHQHDWSHGKHHVRRPCLPSLPYTAHPPWASAVTPPRLSLVMLDLDQYRHAVH